MARSKANGDSGKMVRVAENIYRRGDTKTGVLIVRVWDPAKNGDGGKANFSVQITDHETYKEAVAEAKRVKQEEEARVRARAGGSANETVGSWAPRWQTMVPRKRGESTRKHNDERVQAFVQDFGDRRLAEISKARAECHLWIVGGPALDSLADVARKWKGARVEADGTVIVPGHRGNLAAVRAMFTDAASIGLVDANPFEKMRLEQSRGRKDIVALTQDELNALVRFAAREHGLYGQHAFGPMIEVAAWTGLRPGEMFGLWPEDVDLERKRIYVQRALVAKTKKVGYTKTEGRDDAPVPLLPEAEAAFRRLQVEELPAGEPIFRTGQRKPYTQRNQHYYWDPVRRAFAGSLPESHWLRKRMQRTAEAKIAEGKVPTGSEGNLDFYELRHFFGSRLGESGASPYEIAKAMGHSDGGKLAMEVYIHTEGEDAADRILERWRRFRAA